MAIPSLSYDPATDLEMYPGAIPMNAAASNPNDKNGDVVDMFGDVVDMFGDVVDMFMNE